MFWDDIKLVTEQVEKYGLRTPFVDLGGMERPCIADYDLTIATGDQSARYVGLNQRPFDHIAPDYLILNPDKGDPFIEDLPYSYAGVFGTAVCLNVMEHVQNPFRVMAALYQLLREGGMLIVETVFSFPYHPSPNDYWRFSPDCLRYLAQTAGFTVQECDWRVSYPGDSGILNAENGEPQEIKSIYATLIKGPFTPVPLCRFPLPERFSQNEEANRLIRSGGTRQLPPRSPEPAAPPLPQRGLDPSDLVTYHNLGNHAALLNQLAEQGQLGPETFDPEGRGGQQAADLVLGEHFARLSRATGKIASELLFRAQWGYQTPEWYDHRHHLLNPERHCTDFWTVSADNVIRHLPVGGNLLDLCSGDGFYDYYFFRARAREITCVELHPEAHRAAVRNHSADNIRHILGDALEYEPLTGHFDLVLIRGAIEHFSDADQQRLFTKARRALKPGGWFCGDTVTNVEPGGVSLPSHIHEWSDEAEMRRSLSRSFDHVETSTLFSRERITLLWACQN